MIHVKALRIEPKRSTKKMLQFLLEISVKHFSGIDDITIKIYLDLNQKKKNSENLVFHFSVICVVTRHEVVSTNTRGGTGITSPCS